MQKITTFLYLILMLCFLSSASCEKEQEEPDGPDKLIVGTWLRTNLEYSNSKTNGTWVLWSQPCQMDDTEEFTADGKWIFNGGSIVCSGSSGTPSGTYSLVNEGTKIIIKDNQTSRERERAIEFIDNQNLVTIHNIGDVDNSQARTTYVRR